MHTTEPKVRQRKAKTTIATSRVLHTGQYIAHAIFQGLPKNSFLSWIFNLLLVPSAGKYVYLFITKAKPNYYTTGMGGGKSGRGQGGGVGISFLHRTFYPRINLNSYFKRFHRYFKLNALVLYLFPLSHLCDPFLSGYKENKVVLHEKVKNRWDRAPKSRTQWCVYVWVQSGLHI